MDAYMEFINDIINSRGQYGEKREGDDRRKLEKHHIIPAVLGGEDTKENTIYLSTEEHRYAHFFLGKALIEMRETKSKEN